ncbi:MAG: hypothetical protein M3Q87_04080 [Actinomycetota bacterium]|nr:hypothetical protein [Actinomycetota bacterium]
MPWFACEEPERLIDGLALWHYSGCAGCRFKAAAQLAAHPDDPHVRWLNQVIEDNNNEGGGQ